MPDSLSSHPVDAIPLSEELLSLMRRAAQAAVDLHDSLLTPRAMLLAMLDDPRFGPHLGGIVNVERLRGLSEDTHGAAQAPDTLAFKTPDGSSSVRLSAEAYRIFVAGARRARDRERYDAGDLASGMAAMARSAPEILSAMHPEPGALADALYRV